MQQSFEFPCRSNFKAGLSAGFTPRVVSTMLFLFLLVTSGSQAMARTRSLSGLHTQQARSARVSANVLSEHEIEALDGMPPQSQAELLLERSINHFHGANEQIIRRVGGWRGKIKLDDRLSNLFYTALNSGDLRVRSVAIEIDIAVRDLDKKSSTIDRLEPAAHYSEQGPRANALWDIGLIGNRGVEPQRARMILQSSLHDGNENIRYWAVEGLSYLGTDETIPLLLEVLHDDPSPMIRERAACGIAQSGMLSEAQRRTAVPRLLDFTDDKSLSGETRQWVFQALRDITGQNLPHVPSAWRTWYTSEGRQWHPVTHDSQD